MVSRECLVAGLTAAVLLCGRAGAEEKPVFNDQKEKISYGIGVGVARDFKQRGVEIDVDAFLKGLKDQLSGSKLLMSEKELDTTMDAYTRELKIKREQADKIAAEENRKAGEAFLAANAPRKEVVTLPSGLQYKILTAGKGDPPSDADAVEVKYRGRLLDGTEFDSSSRRSAPAVLTVNGVVPGLQEALKLMSPGSKWEIYVPSALAYGDRKVYRIGPNSTLIFEVELLSVLRAGRPKEAAGAQASPAGAGNQPR